jgi:glycosyltransferase involved in cell wall biosynthesis
MHVALCSPAWPLARHHNGIVTYVHWTKLELERLGHRVSVFSGLVDVPSNGVHKVVRPALSTALRRLTSRFASPHRNIFDWSEVISAAMLEVHRRDPIDVIEMEETFGWFAEVARLTSLPLLVKLHGPSFLSLVEEELATPFGRECVEREGVALAGASAIASPCQITLDQTRERYGLSPAISEHVVNPVAVDPSAPRWTLDGCDHQTILFVGRFDKRKGGDLVIDAFARLLQTRPELRLVFVGPDRGLTQPDGSRIHFAEYLASALPPALRARVDFRGPLPQPEVVRLRAQALVTVIASRWENQGYTGLEAMLQACPIVCSDAGGGPEIISHGRTGLLSRTGDAADLAEKLDMILSDLDGAATLGAAAHAFVTEVHAPARVAAQSLELYQRVIAARGLAR